MDAPINNDLPLDADVAELRREAQKAVDREIAARTELAAAIANREEVRAKVAAGAADALAFIDAYVNPAVPAPAPIAPEVAAPAPAVEPPVFTTVDSADVAPDNSSGGVSEVAPELEVLPPVEDGEAPADGAIGSQGE